MATKPSSVVRWADVGGAIVVPTSGKMDIGHVAGERPPAQIENWVKNLVGQWQAYLSDGILDGKFGVRGTLSPSAFSGTQNDYSPTNLATAAFLRLAPSAAATITGIAGGEAGRMLWLVNTTANRLSISHDAGGSSAANRIYLPRAAATLYLGQNDFAVLRYDETSSRWRVVHTTGDLLAVRKISALGNIQANDSDAAGISTSDGYVVINHVTAQGGSMGLVVEDLSRIRTIDIVCNPGASTGLTARIRRISATGTVTTIASVTSSATGWQKLNLGTLDHDVVADATYYMVFEVSTAPSSVAGVHLVPG